MSETDEAAQTRPATPVPALVAIGGLLGLLYAYALWQAIGNLVGAAQQASEVGLALNGLGWFLWIFAILFPVIVFAAAFALSWKRGTLAYTLALLMGLGLVAVFWLNVVAYTSLNTTAVLTT
ncbi:bacitracin resistance protein [Microbacterium sp. LRZ72]|uniref:bacitracin resistance protein n=1 Tax=Microbacterium sp. LRZ72 TaxID=2942481 RepID=UPI0029BF625E|nr:bacitracin resistance protein [Microbacterium sp. LRZ72]MDX2375652.1 bacitracin resistance protein [Microbacterium sp. LRZ72]